VAGLSEPPESPPRPGRSPGSAEGRGPGQVRTYAGRRGRLSALNRQRLAVLGPLRFPPEGPLDPVRAFGRTAPLVLEVGCGHGAAAVAYAATHPGHDVLAVDVHTPGIARLLAAAEAADVPNLRVVVGDALDLLSARVRPGQLSAVHVFFPDPWPKSKHAKRRFLRADTLALLDSRLAEGGSVLIATDDRGYAAHVRSVVEEHGGFVARQAERPRWRPVDGFERKAQAAGRPIVELRLERARRIELP
jgi:tRNA (guanine-N7-)-methyltransferase